MENPHAHRSQYAYDKLYEINIEFYFGKEVNQ